VKNALLNVMTGLTLTVMACLISDDITGIIDWLGILSTHVTADSLWAAFSDVLQAAIDLCVPVK